MSRIETTVILAAGIAAVFVAGAIASDTHHHAVDDAGNLKWTAPAAYAKDAPFAVVHGDPSKSAN